MSSPTQDDEKRRRFTEERPCPIHQRLCPFDERRQVVFCGRCGFEHRVEQPAAGPPSSDPEREKENIF